MKMNSFLGSLVLGVCLSSTTFGFDLLDRMIGMSGCGCAAASSCCDTAPSCGCDAGCADPGCCAATPSCGCETACGCGKKRGGLFSGLRRNKKSCGCDVVADPCGCASACDPCGCASACDPCGCGDACGCAAPSCGCDTGCCAQPTCCKKQRGGLLNKLFGNRCRKAKSCGCDVVADPCGCASGNGCAAAAGCGCGAVAAPVMGAPSPAPVTTPSADDAPMPPAPVVDPSAMVPSKRRIVHASTLIR